MFLVDITDGAWTNGNAIPISTSPKIATNSNVTLGSNNSIIINTAGWYKVRLQAVVDATSTSIGAILVANGTSIEDTEVTVTTVAQDNAEIVIEYPLHVIDSQSQTNASLQFNATASGTGVNGYITVERIS